LVLLKPFRGALGGCSAADNSVGRNLELHRQSVVRCGLSGAIRADQQKTSRFDPLFFLWKLALQTRPTSITATQDGPQSTVGEQPVKNGRSPQQGGRPASFRTKLVGFTVQDENLETGQQR